MTETSEASDDSQLVQPSGFPVKPVLVFSIGVVVALVVVYVFAAIFLQATGRPTDELRTAATPWEPEDPADLLETLDDWPPPLRPDPESDYEALRAAQLERLESYGWVDREQGIVHIPIDDAIDLVLRDVPIAPEGEPAAKEGGR